MASRASASSSAEPTWAGRGTGTAILAWRATCRPTIICPCSTKWTTCPKTATPRAGDLRPLPGHRQEIRPVRTGGLPDHCDLYGVGRSRTDVAPHHRPRRPHEGAVRDLCQRHALQAEAGSRSKAWSPSKDTPFILRAGTTTTPGRTSAWKTKSSASSARAQRRCRPFPASAQCQRAVRVSTHAFVH